MAQIVGALIGLALVVALYPDAAASADDVVVPHQRNAPHVDVDRGARHDRKPSPIRPPIGATTSRSTSNSHSRPPRPDWNGSSTAPSAVETIERFLHSSYDQFAGRATVPNFLPLLAERFARQRLNALARVEGKITDGKPTVLFLCTHNAGRSQMALGFFTHLAGDRRRGLVGWLRARQRDQPIGNRGHGRGRHRHHRRVPQTLDRRNRPSRRRRRSRWAAATPARSFPASATRTGNYQTRPANPLTPSAQSATTSKNECAAS